MSMGRILTISFLLAASFGAEQRAQAGSEAHGGDGLMLLFEHARQQLHALMTPDLIDKLPASTPAEVRTWLAINRVALAEDLARTTHDWVTRADSDEFCAMTNLHAAPITFSVKACRESVLSVRTAMEVLAHESLHHFGIADERFPSEVAIAVAATAANPVLAADGLWVPFPEGDYPCQDDPQRKPRLAGLGARFVVLEKSVSFRPPCGGIYDFATKAWQAISFEGAPPFLEIHAIATFHDRVFVWGVKFGGRAGLHVAALYDPETATWQSLTLPPELDGTAYRYKLHPTEAGMVVWGALGNRQGAVFDRNAEGGRLMSLSSALDVSDNQAGFVIGKRLLTFGLNSRGMFAPEENLWFPTQTPVPLPMLFEKMIAAWDDDGARLYAASDNDLYAYDPDVETWSEVSRLPQDLATSDVIWTGSRILVWGADARQKPVGFLFEPSQTDWRVINFEGGPPSPEVLTGKETLWVDDRLVAWSRDYKGIFFHFGR